MSLLNKKRVNRTPGMLGFTLLHVAELALGVSAIFGFLAVLGLILMPWTLVLVATSIAVVALVAAVVLLIIPPSFLSGKLTDKGEPSLFPKNRGAEKIRYLTCSAHKISESSSSNKHRSLMLASS